MVLVAGPEGLIIVYAMENAMISVSIKNWRLRMSVPVHLNGNEEEFT